MASAARKAAEVLERLSKHIIPEPMSGCHLWIGATTGGGYGHTRIGGKNMRAHRAVWELTHGPIPDGLWVLHRCDNPACVNPLHLFLGTHIDNMRDVVSKGRHVGQKKRFCKYGHALEGDNVRMKGRWRTCVACQRRWSAELNRKPHRRERDRTSKRERYANDPVYREQRLMRAAKAARRTA